MPQLLPPPPSERAFSLVELSIVLVILGLLTGGILAGQSLIRAAELRSVSTEYARYVAAVNTFRDKYFQLPGDMTNAHSFWGSAGGSGVVGDGCETGSTTSTETCSGNGDGNIDAYAASEFGERFTFWQHLANAGLVEGSYTGIAGSGGAGNAILGENAPRSKMGNAGWSLWYIPNYAGNSEFFAYDYQNSLFFGAQTPTLPAYAAILRPEEAWNIDTKMDDGKPGSGKLMSMRNLCTDSTGVADYGASYALSEDSVVCRIVFHNIF